MIKYHLLPDVERNCLTLITISIQGLKWKSRTVKSQQMLEKDQIKK